jgi:hypothetical protein
MKVTEIERAVTTAPSFVLIGQADEVADEY